MAGWIKLYRCLLDKPIWECSTPEQKAILTTILLLANHDEKQWIWQGKKYKCNPGQFVTSLEKLAKKSGTSIRNVRTALKNFEHIYDFLTYETTNKNTLVTIINWGYYQSSDTQTDTQSDKQVTSTRQASDKQVTTNKNDKELKNDKNDKEVIYIAEIIDYLNQKARTNYRTSSDKTKSLIRTRLSDGFSVIDFKTVIDKKCTDWLSDPKMSKYLRPETLFGTKFEGYLNERQGKKIPRAFASLLEKEDDYEQRGSAEIIDVSDF